MYRKQAQSLRQQGPGRKVLPFRLSHRKFSTTLCVIRQCEIRDGWMRIYVRCHGPFVLSWVCGAVRDGREKLCQFYLATGAVQ